MQYIHVQWYALVLVEDATVEVPGDKQDMLPIIHAKCIVHAYM